MLNSLTEKENRILKLRIGKGGQTVFFSQCSLHFFDNRTKLGGGGETSCP